jgi:hypothetical protein
MPAGVTFHDRDNNATPFLLLLVNLTGALGSNRPRAHKRNKRRAAEGGGGPWVRVSQAEVHTFDGGGSFPFNRPAPRRRVMLCPNLPAPYTSIAWPVLHFCTVKRGRPLVLVTLCHHSHVLVNLHGQLTQVGSSARIACTLIG